MDLDYFIQTVCYMKGIGKTGNSMANILWENKLMLHQINNANGKINLLQAELVKGN